MKHIKSASKMLKMFDENANLFSIFCGIKKDFSLIINTLELFVKQMKLTREISQQVKKELENFNDDEFVKEVRKRFEPIVAPIQKDLNKINSKEFHTLLFALPDKKGRKFFEMMERLEEAGELKINNPSKREKIDSVISDLENYILEIKEISKPFVPAKVDSNRTIIFKVILKYRKGIWRKIELKAEQTLEDLHDLIQDALGWDDNHLYSFFMDNKFYSKEDMEYTRPSNPEGRKTADIKAGVFGFKKGQKFAYLFDFGDEHRFEIEVVNFGTVQKGKKYPVLLESKGKSPEQYTE